MENKEQLIKEYTEGDAPFLTDEKEEQILDDGLSCNETKKLSSVVKMTLSEPTSTSKPNNDYI